MPQVCFGCSAHLSGGEHLLCTVCRHDLPLTEYNFRTENPVDTTFYGRIQIKKAASFLFFTRQGTVKNLLHHLKYKNQKEIGFFLGEWYGSVLQKDKGLPDIDVVVPVPLHARKLRKRGYNQVTAFAKRLAFHLNSTFSDQMLIKTTDTRTQTKKNRLFRWQNVQDLYELVHPDQLRHKTVLLVDDVITTGATIEACAKALQKAKGITIYVATMAFVPKLGL
ncbi:MAG: ComF family protein [Allomuricauda sp.]|nr:MAG: ComF family protein [Allomuricauda sp.]